MNDSINQHLPLAHKSLIQTSYLRSRDLDREISEASTRLRIGEFAHWGGLAIFVFFIVREINGHEWPEFVGGAALFTLFVGWAYKIDQRKKVAALREEWQQIRQEMRELGVHLGWHSDRIGSVTVGSNVGGAELSVFDDSAYR